MYCPNCAAENTDGARFCRVCGANVSLVPQAMTGTLPDAPAAVGFDAEGKPYDATGRRTREREPSFDKAIKNIFMGVGFLVVAIALSFSRMGAMWWFWMLIPAFTMLGGGVAEYIRVKNKKQIGPSAWPSIPTMPPATPRASALPRSNAVEPNMYASRDTGELVPPPSVTENTTRHLDLSTEAPTRHIGAPIENAKDKI